MRVTRSQIQSPWGVVSQKPVADWTPDDLKCIWEWIETQYRYFLMYALKKLRRLVGDKASPRDAEEVVHDVLLYLFVSGHIRTFDPSRGDLPGFLHTCFTHACERAAKKIGERQETSLHIKTADGEFEIEIEAEDPESDPEGAAASAEVRRAVQECIKSLRHEGHRNVIIMHYLEDQELHAIAEILSQPIGTVKVWLMRARLLLRTCLRGKVSRS